MARKKLYLFGQLNVLSDGQETEIFYTVKKLRIK